MNCFNIHVELSPFLFSCPLSFSACLLVLYFVPGVYSNTSRSECLIRSSDCSIWAYPLYHKKMFNGLNQVAKEVQEREYFDRTRSELVLQDPENLKQNSDAMLFSVEVIIWTGCFYTDQLLINNALGQYPTAEITLPA